MNNTRDLHIEKEILPLFDYTLNMFSKKVILNILEQPLSSVAEIENRQHILKGFAANKEIIEKYSYTISYLLEVHHFLNDVKIEDLPKKKLEFKLFTSKIEKAKFRSKMAQLILFFNRLELYYFSRLKLEFFPESYQKKLKEIKYFLSQFNLSQLDHLIREHKFRDSHIIILSKKISELKLDEEISKFWENFFLFEAYLSINKAIQKQDFIFPKLTKNSISLKEFYHPLLKNPVTNNFESSSNVILLNGPNMSGKSTFLKAISLCVYLGHVGVGIPASTGEVPFFANFSIAINRRDDILNGYSHFMTEVVNLKKVVIEAEKGSCLAVFDELFSGTNVEDAFEICKTTIRGLSKYSNSMFFISTHIQKLKEIDGEGISMYYIDCELVDNTPTFTYKIKEGWSEIKVGRILFDKEGLNKMLN